MRIIFTEFRKNYIMKYNVKILIHLYQKLLAFYLYLFIIA